MSSKWEIWSDKKTEEMGDMFGIFFEDLNHAADFRRYIGLALQPL